jgi:methylglutaconyl-CoA hydratase
MAKADYQTIKVVEREPVVTITLSRPEVRNAFDETLIAELTDAIRSFDARRDIRVAVLTGAGDVFSAGADLNWMRKVADYTYDENVADAMGLADLVETLYTMPQATIARVNGPCIGGALGLVSACDVAVASSNAFFAFREVRLGITPATISPYVIRKIGERNARDYFLTGRQMDTETAEAIGLVNEVAEPERLDEFVERWSQRFLHSGPDAVKVSKQLIARVSRAQIRDVKAYTADVIAKLRGSDEGKEGFAAFFEKRKPRWDKEK